MDKKFDLPSTYVAFRKLPNAPYILEVLRWVTESKDTRPYNPHDLELQYPERGHAWSAAKRAAVDAQRRSLWDYGMQCIGGGTYSSPIHQEALDTIRCLIAWDDCGVWLSPDVTVDTMVAVLEHNPAAHAVRLLLQHKRSLERERHDRLFKGDQHGNKMDTRR